MPTTPFEDATGDFTDWTTLAEEEAFLRDVESQSRRVSMQSLGDTAQDRPIYEVRVGYPEAPTAKELRDKDCMLVIGGQHGDEPSGREAALQHLRDLAETEDSSLTTYLSDHPIIYIPTANPDGRADDSRTNSFGRDVNRQYLSYQDEEASALGLVLRHYRPAIVIDTHEKFSSSGTDFETLYPTNTEVESGISSLAQSLNTAAQSALSGSGFTEADYSGGTGVNILRNNVGLRNRIGLLVEAYGQGNTDGITRKEAVAGCLLIMEEAVSWHISNESGIADAIINADARSKADGEDQASISDPSISAPLGYELTDAQYQSVVESMDRLRISWWHIEGRDDRYVPMGQPTKRLIPFLMDSAADNNEVSATSVDTEPTLIEPPLTASGFKVRDVRDAGSSVAITVQVP